MIGQTVSHYRIEEKLGAGGMGEVYRAIDIRLDRAVALKRLSPALAANPKHRKRFQQEARAAAKLNHPGIAAVHEMEEVGDELYIIYEYVPGETLRKVIASGALDRRQMLSIAAAIARALSVAHAQGIVHRDLKPENIMRTPEGQSKILDFGLAHIAPDFNDGQTASMMLSEPGVIVGTLSYMSPEQLESRQTDFRTDLFSFGVLLYEMMTGNRPFQAGSGAGTIAAILASEPPPLSQDPNIASPELERILRKCLRKNPAERYQSTEDLAVDLELLLRDAPAAITTVASDATSHDSDGMLHQVFAPLTPNLLRWWEGHTLFTAFFLCPLAVYFAWLVRPWVPAPWGLALFLATSLCAAVNFSLRLYLLNIAIWNPSGLPAEVARMKPWILGVSWGVVGSLLAMGGATVEDHIGVSSMVLGLGVMGAVAILVIEPAVHRGVSGR